MYRKRLLVCISFPAILLALFPIASLGQTYQIPWDVIDGGGNPSISSTHRIYTSIAQSVIGASYGSNYRVYAGFWTPCIILEPGIKEESQRRTPPIPKTFELHPIFPNPFRTKTTVKYELPEECQISLKVYNVSGQLVKTLFSGRKTAGIYQIDWNTKELPSGIYFLRLETEKQSLTRRIVIVK